MKFSPDWHYLRPALMVVVMALLFSGALKLIGYNYVGKMQLLHEEKSVEHADAEAKLSTLREDGQIIEEYAEKFSVLARAGLFDQKKRIDWVDAVNSARSEMRLPMVRYQISPQSIFQSEYMPVDEHVAVMSSHVKFEAGLLHEGDLIDLFSWMMRYVPGQLHLSQCEMSRTEQYFGYYADRPNLNVICDFNWMTMLPLTVEEKQ